MIGQQLMASPNMGKSLPCFIGRCGAKINLRRTRKTPNTSRSGTGSQMDRRVTGWRPHTKALSRPEKSRRRPKRTQNVKRSRQLFGQPKGGITKNPFAAQSLRPTGLFGRALQVFLDTLIVGNLLEKSFTLAATLIATWRATLLYRPAISPSGSATTLGMPLSACTRILMLSGNAPR